MTAQPVDGYGVAVMQPLCAGTDPTADLRPYTAIGGLVVEYVPQISTSAALMRMRLCPPKTNWTPALGPGRTQPPGGSGFGGIGLWQAPGIDGAVPATSGDVCVPATRYPVSMSHSPLPGK